MGGEKKWDEVSIGGLSIYYNIQVIIPGRNTQGLFLVTIHRSINLFFLFALLQIIIIYAWRVIKHIIKNIKICKILLLFCPYASTHKASFLAVSLSLDRS